MVKPNVRSTDFKNADVYVKKILHVDGAKSGPKLQYQRAEVPPGGDCETVGDFTEEANGVWDVSAVGSSKIGANSIRMTQTGIVTGKSIYLQFSGPKDLSWAKYLGLWYKGKAGVTYHASDLIVYLFTKKGNVLYAARTLSSGMGGYVEENPAVWHYAEILISGMTIASGKGGEANLKEVWGIGFCAAAMANTETMDADQIEFYTHGTGYGAARGTIMTAPILDGITVAIGNTLRWGVGGRVDLSIDNEPAFAGIAVAGGTGDEAGSGFTDFVVDGPVNMKCSDANIAADEGICMSAAGTAPTIDDGGAGAQAYEMGKALEAGALNRVITVILKGFGFGIP